MIRNAGAGETAMNIAPKMLKKMLPRVTMRSFTAALSPNLEVRAA
jgi:hypothetical protein